MLFQAWDGARAYLYLPEVGIAVGPESRHLRESDAMALGVMIVVYVFCFLVMILGLVVPSAASRRSRGSVWFGHHPCWMPGLVRVLLPRVPVHDDSIEEVRQGELGRHAAGMMRVLDPLKVPDVAPLAVNNHSLILLR